MDTPLLNRDLASTDIPSGRSLISSDRVNFTNRDNQYTTTLTTLRGAPDNGSEEHILASHPNGHTKDTDGATSIIRIVEFDVENTSTAA